MNTIKFPSTPHLMSSSSLIRTEKVLNDFDLELLLTSLVTVEEKIDGANIGISFDNDGILYVQNRGSYITKNTGGQWAYLYDWINQHIDNLFDNLSNKYILFGEWCYAKHSVFYNSLPDFFLAFDIYVKEESSFMCTANRDKLIFDMRLNKVPFLAYGNFSIIELKNMIQKSKYGENMSEGIYIRLDEAQWNKKRAKLVRDNFIQSDDYHWSKTKIIHNQIDYISDYTIL